MEVHDIVCHIADAVLAGGIRRAALISLFSAYDEEMISCKSGSWWETNPQRGRANESFPMRWKLFKKFIKNDMPHVTLYKPQNQKECDKVIELIIEKNKNK